MITAWAALESMAARLITENAGAEEIASLRTMFAKFENGELHARLDEYSEVNIEFHQTIIRMSRNGVLISLAGVPLCFLLNAISYIAVLTGLSLMRNLPSLLPELFGLAGGWLREWQPAGPVSGVAIEIPELESAGRRQLRLWVGCDAVAEEVQAALERLQERHGETVAVRLVPALTRSGVPAQRYVAEPA